MTSSATRLPIAFVATLAISLPLPAPVRASGLNEDLGRNETRIYSQRYGIEAGRTVTEIDLARRLESRGFLRVRGRRPERPGEYFWGFERFWIFRPATSIGKQRHPARLFGLSLRRSDGLILGGIDERDRALATKHLWIAPTILAESFNSRTALTERISFEDLSEHTWRAVLAAEDARFFEHSGVDARSLARALLKNVKAGEVVQGGSTITQQLIKIRDLSPKRSLGRKASEAVRALALEADYDKTEILEAYLNAVYYGHIDAIQLYGIGTAARAYFSKPASELDLAESALLAAIIQGPNRLSPVRNPEAVLDRYRWVLSRLAELEWAADAELASARRRLPSLRISEPPLPKAPHFLNWLESDVEARAPKVAAGARGAVVYSTLDPLVQEAALLAATRGMRQIEGLNPGLASRPLNIALVALDTRSGDVLAYIGGDPRATSDTFDRARRAQRQPGSTVKPLILLEAFQRCGPRKPVYPARQVSDRPLTIDLPSGAWSPRNPDGRFRDSISIRQATESSLNLPFVRIARWCGLEATAERVRRAGLELPEEAGPAYVLGAIEQSPLDMAQAYTTFASLGRAWRPRSWQQIHLPGGARLDRQDPRARKVVSPPSAYLARNLLGKPFGGTMASVDAFGKTGTSSNSRDAWFVGGGGSVVAAVWVGLDDGQTLGLSGRQAAAPIWREFMERAVPLRPAHDPERPDKVIERWIQIDTGLLVSRQRSGSELELFRNGATPPKRRLWRRDEPLPVID